MSCDIKLPIIDPSCGNLLHLSNKKTFLMKATDLKFDKNGNFIGIKRKYGKHKRQAIKF